jgi:hypothetical protein
MSKSVEKFISLSHPVFIEVVSKPSTRSTVKAEPEVQAQEYINILSTDKIGYTDRREGMLQLE